jgi:hypothetical protein
MDRQEEQVTDVRLEVAYYTGMQIGIDSARPKWSEERKLELFHDLTARAVKPVRKVVDSVMTVPEIVTWVMKVKQVQEEQWREVIKEAEDERRSEVATLERMLRDTDKREGRR